MKVDAIINEAICLAMREYDNNDAERGCAAARAGVEHLRASCPDQAERIAAVEAGIAQAKSIEDPTERRAAVGAAFAVFGEGISGDEPQEEPAAAGDGGEG